MSKMWEVFENKSEASSTESTPLASDIEGTVNQSTIKALQNLRIGSTAISIPKIVSINSAPTSDSEHKLSLKRSRTPVFSQPMPSVCVQQDTYRFVPCQDRRQRVSLASTPSWRRE